MSRSYKKNPIFKGNHCKKSIKREASKKVRRAAHVGNFCSYKRVYDSYNIVDWKRRETMKEYTDVRGCYPLLGVFKEKDWEKRYKRK